jgi:hypothetical protein
MRTLRWILAVPAAFAGFYLGVFAALLIYGVNERSCPSEYVVSGMCYAPWSSFVSNLALAVGSLICGSLVVLFPTLIAPVSRKRVAFFAYALGMVASIYWLFHGSWVPVAWAVLSGGFTVWRIEVVLTTRSSGPSNGWSRWVPFARHASTAAETER